MRKITLSTAVQHSFISCNNNSEKTKLLKQIQNRSGKQRTETDSTAMPDSAAMMKAWQDL